MKKVFCRSAWILCSIPLLTAATHHRPTAQVVTPATITNPSFETPYNTVLDDNGQVTGAVANGWQNNGGYGDVTAVYSQNTANPHSGTSCQEIALSAIRSGELQMYQPAAFKGGNIYTVSVWLRGEAGATAELFLQGGAPNYAQLASISMPLTGSWQQFSTQGYVATDVSSGAIMVAMSSPGTIYIDDIAVSYTPGTLQPSPNLGPISPTFFGMHVANYSENVFRNGGMEPPFRSAGVSPNSISGNIAYNWIDNSSWANVAVTYSQDVNNPHHGKSAQQISVQSVTSGQVQLTQPTYVIPGVTYTMTAWVRGQAGLNAYMQINNQDSPYNNYASTPLSTLTSQWQQFSVTGQVNDSGKIQLMFVVAGPGTLSIDDVTFTTSTGSLFTGGGQWPQKPFGTLRLWDSDTTWSILEPQKGVWNFQNLDRWVSLGIDQDIILTLGQSPTWASSSPATPSYYGAGAPAPPTNIQDWTDYVTAVARRYQGRIRFYEVWNEPNDPNYYAGTVAQLVQLTQAARQALKSVDPQNVLISPPAYSPGYLDMFLGAGAAPYIDVIGYHAYATPPEDTGRQLGNVRLVMAKYGLQNMPLWDTEAASGDTTTTPDTTAAAYLVRKYLTDLAYGAGRLDWYTWGPATSFCVGTEMTDARLLTSAGTAYGVLHGWLQGASLTQAAVDAAGDWQIGLTLSSGKKGLIVWNPNANTTFTIPSTITVSQQQDIFGNLSAFAGATFPVTASPVLLIGN